MADARSRGRYIDVVVLVDLLRRSKFEVRGRRLDFDDVRAELAFSLKRDMLLALLSLRIVGTRPAKVSAPASRKPRGAA